MDPSPLTRGKLTLTHSLPLPHWLIPAHAGKTTNARPANQSPPAHPRSRGENVVGRQLSRLHLGSSPLTRGKRKHRVEHRLHGGLIPAHAGKTQDQPRRTPQTSAHPRSRGENGPGDRACLTSSGSSPLTRGKRLADLRDGLNLRLIPAHAGKTTAASTCAPSHPAHPRSRGENRAQTPRCRRGWGSSPLTRGKLVAVAEDHSSFRLIPAHAGKTVFMIVVVATLTAHPRSRGENAGTASRRESRAGSSPLTRGKQGGYRVNGRGLRLIPAHAGKTCATSTGNSHAPAHPRSRGENAFITAQQQLLAGSSPLTRGKL